MRVLEWLRKRGNGMVRLRQQGLHLLPERWDRVVLSRRHSEQPRRVFQYAARHRSVLFFDEFDVLGKDRDDPQEAGELTPV